MTKDPTQQESLRDGYEALLLSYAAGNLDEAQSLAVATHLTFSDKARTLVRQCEDLGGALIESQCTPVSMTDGALNNVLDHIESTEYHSGRTDKESMPAPDLGFTIPKPLKDTITGQSVKWAPLLPGMKACDIHLNCKNSAARFMKAAPGCVTPHHKHGGMEITLVLDGAFWDETGQYQRGDLIVTDEHYEHTPHACKKHGCVSLVVTSAPIKLTGIASLLNPFLKL